MVDKDPTPEADAVPGDSIEPDIRDETTGTEAGVVATEAAVPTGRRGLRALVSTRMSGASMLIAVLVGLLGFALIVQVKSNSSESTLVNDRPDDLVRILSDLDARKDRLTTEISALQDTQRQLANGAQGRQAALAEASRRADELGILAGTLAATGPGLSITLAPVTRSIAAADVLDTVEELRGAGAEAMQVSGSGGGTVRVVASTFFIDTTGGVLVDGHTLTGTLTIDVIGDPQTMQTAISIPGGPVDTIKQHGGNLLIGPPGTIRVTALHFAGTMRYAHPVS